MPHANPGAGELLSQTIRPRCRSALTMAPTTSRRRSGFAKPLMTFYARRHEHALSYALLAYARRFDTSTTWSSTFAFYYSTSAAPLKCEPTSCTPRSPTPKCHRDAVVSLVPKTGEVLRLYVAQKACHMFASTAFRVCTTCNGCTARHNFGVGADVQTGSLRHYPIFPAKRQGLDQPT